MNKQSKKPEPAVDALIINKKKNWYENLFSFFAENHDLTFTETEISDIIDEVHKVSKQGIEPCPYKTIIINRLKNEADSAYISYIKAHGENECLGWEVKVLNGNFGSKELEAHKKAQEWFGKHCAYNEAIRAIKEDCIADHDNPKMK